MANEATGLKTAWEGAMGSFGGPLQSPETSLGETDLLTAAGGRDIALRSFAADRACPLPADRYRARIGKWTSAATFCGN